MGRGAVIVAILGLVTLESCFTWIVRFRKGSYGRLLRPYVHQESKSNWDSSEAPKLDFNEDYYSVLEVDPSISTQDLKREYYKIVCV